MFWVNLGPTAMSNPQENTLLYATQSLISVLCQRNHDAQHILCS